MSYKDILYNKGSGIATITLNRPQARNALKIESYHEVSDAILEANRDPEVRALVITGADPAFCAGDDVKQWVSEEDKKKREVERKSRIRPGDPVTSALMIMQKPVIAAVNGAAVGMGCGIALICDIRIASDRARFGQFYILRGLLADPGGTYFMPRLIGLGKTYELLFTGDMIDAQEAERIGMVNKVVPHEQLMEATMAMANKITSMPPLAVLMAKHAVRRGLSHDFEAVQLYEAYCMDRLWVSEEHDEAAKGLTEQRDTHEVGGGSL